MTAPDALTVLRDAIDEVEEMKSRMRGRERNAVGCVAVVLRERLARLEREQAEANPACARSCEDETVLRK